MVCLHWQQKGRDICTVLMTTNYMYMIAGTCFIDRHLIGWNSITCCQIGLDWMWHFTTVKVQVVTTYQTSLSALMMMFPWSYCWKKPEKFYLSDLMTTYHLTFQCRSFIISASWRAYILSCGLKTFYLRGAVQSPWKKEVETLKVFCGSLNFVCCWCCRGRHQWRRQWEVWWSI